MAKARRRGPASGKPASASAAPLPGGSSGGAGSGGDGAGKKRKKAHHRKKKKKHDEERLPPPDADDVGADIDDVVEQLRRQRLKQRRQQRSSDGDASAGAVAERGGGGGGGDAIERAGGIIAGGGHYQYDPVLKKYFPVDSRSNDVLVRRTRERLDAREEEARRRDRDAPEGSNDDPFRGRGAVTDVDVTRIAFRGTRMPGHRGDNSSGRERRRRIDAREDARGGNGEHYFPCTDRSTLLLASAMEYCAGSSSSRRRRAIASVLGPASVARRGRIAPVSSTLEAIRMHSSIIDAAEEVCSSGGRVVRPHCAAPIHRRRRRDSGGAVWKFRGARDAYQESMARAVRSFSFSMLSPLGKHPRLQ